MELSEEDRRHFHEHFLSKAADSEISLVWDRYEEQLPELFCKPAEPAGIASRDPASVILSGFE